MHASVTFDMEHDCPPYLKTYRGVAEASAKILNLVKEEGVRATFFTTGDVARRFPEIMRAIVTEGHELGCHSDTHPRFSKITEEAARREIETSSAVLRAFAPVRSFRAPNLDFPAHYLALLRETGYDLDSSQGRYKPGSFFVAPRVELGLTRIPASTPPSVVRLPRALRHAAFRRMRSPVVLYFHPWEFVDMTSEPIPIDSRFGTGQHAFDTLRDAIRFFRARGATFYPMRDLPFHAARHAGAAQSAA